MDVDRLASDYAIIPSNIAPANIRLQYDPYYSSLSEHTKALQAVGKRKMKCAGVGVVGGGVQLKQ